MMISVKRNIAILFFVLPTAGYCYDPVTHRAISIQATEQSNLTKISRILADIGITKDSLFKNSNGDGNNYQTLIGDGAEFEDKNIRAMNHFYNPITGKGLPLFKPSPDWALEDKGEIEDSEGGTGPQRHSYRDARQYLYQALTSTDKATRDKNFGLTFQTLGQVIHHIQDMAQPQHSRLDLHCDTALCLLLFNPSRYEQYTLTDLKMKIEQGRLTYTGYPNVSFSKPRQYWTTQEGSQSGKGMADYSNRNFHSAGTIFSSAFPLPVRNPATEKATVQTLFTTAGLANKIPFECTGMYSPLPGDCYMTFFTNPVTDPLYPSLNDVNKRGATYSVFDQDLIDQSENKGEWWEKGVYSLNRFNFDEAHRFLIKRAVGYSAGLIDYFFRGRMEISAPDEGVYGLIDHATVNQKDVQGFSKIKLKLKNTTPPIVEGSDPTRHLQDMPAGKLVAVARFRRNLCYEPDLTGELVDGVSTWNGCSRANYRTPSEEFLLSREVEVSSLSADPTATPKNVTFDFDIPIPINATDLYLQVVYRGSLGDETDAVAVTRLDLREPTYFSLVNGSDYFMVDGEFYTHDVINNNPALLNRLGVLYTTTDAVDLVNIKMQWVPDKTVVEIAHLPPSSYARVAYLSDKDNMKLTYSYSAYYHQPDAQGKLIALPSGSGSVTVASKINQTTNVYNDPVSIVAQARGTYYWQMKYFYQSNDYKWGGSLTPAELIQKISELPELTNTQPITIDSLF